MSDAIIREQAARIDALLRERETFQNERHLFILDAERRRLIDECERLKTALRLRDEQLSRVQEELRTSERRRSLLPAGNADSD